VTFVWHAACEGHFSAIGSQASNKPFGHHPSTQLNRHRSILYIAGDSRARQALGVTAAENYRVISAAHPPNASLEFGTDQIEGDRIDRMQNHLDLSVLTLNPKRNRPHNFQNHGVALLSNATLRTTALPL